MTSHLNLSPPNYFHLWPSTLHVKMVIKINLLYIPIPFLSYVFIADFVTKKRAIPASTALVSFDGGRIEH